MRITTKMFYDRFLSDMQKNMETIFKASEQISTQKKINRPSDDPTAMSRILGYTTSISAIGEYKRAIDSAKGFLDAADSSFAGLNDILTRAKELALSGATGTTDANSRLMIAKEVGVLFESAVGIANTKVGDRYIFSGYKSNIAPIDVNTGEFVADTNIFEVSISQTIEIGLNIPAGELFSFKRINSTDPQNAILPSYNYNFDSTNDPLTGEPETPPDADPISALHIRNGGGVADPTALNSGTTNGGDLTITVGDNDTTPVTINIAAGASLNDVRDAINAANAEVKANIINFGTSSSPDYRIVIASNPVGQSDKIKIVVSQTISDGAGAGLNRFSYDPDYQDDPVKSNMKLDADGIANYNYIIDTSNPNYYSFNNNYLNENNVLRALHFLKVSLEMNDIGRIQKALDYINKVAEKVYQQQAEVGARLNKLDQEFNFQDNRENDLQTYLSNDQDADIPKLTTQLAQSQAALESLRVASSDFLRTSLFDFIK
ncbi:flagellar hook-associated protein 3 [hot springs metagenome]|uniref:Flagellar hook-associated protein 3 n=1 Tax=hot springs metagenome TaxID=433727 RepID=A0A5J4L2N7_9ZZZZ